LNFAMSEPHTGTSGAAPPVAGSDIPSADLEAAQRLVAQELERGMEQLMERALGQLDRLGQRIDGLDAQLETANARADRMSECRRQSAALRDQLSSARRDLLMAETLNAEGQGSNPSAPAE